MVESPAVDENGGASWTELEATGSTAQLELERVVEGGPQEDEEPCCSGSEPLDKVTGFSLQLMEEFCTQYKLEDTLAAMRAELQRKGIARPDDQLWFEMHKSCRLVLARGGATGGSTLERLVAFCVSPKAARAAGMLALDVAASPVTLCLASPQPNSISKLKQTSFSLKQAYSQMLSPVVRPSQRHKQHGAASSTPAAVDRPKKNSSVRGSKEDSASDAILQLDGSRSRPSSRLAPVDAQHQAAPSKKHKAKKKRSHSNGNNTAISQLPRHPSRTESSMVMAYDEQIKRDLSSGRLLARELRVLRAERVKCDTLRRGAASLEAALARHDPYAKELVRERYGFIHRVECALCTFPFLPVNLPHRVSFKCVMDLHELWGYWPPQRELAARYRPPLCYDAVSVCRMCGPILFQYTTATPSVYDKSLSPTMQRARSLNALTPSAAAPKARSPVDTGERQPFCSDPYALPPLLGDDVIEDGDSYSGEEVTNEVRGGGAGSVQEFPAKAIVYSQQQTNTTAFMSSKEWEIINPTRSSIRQVMESTVKGT